MFTKPAVPHGLHTEPTLSNRNKDGEQGRLALYGARQETGDYRQDRGKRVRLMRLGFDRWHAVAAKRFLTSRE